MSEVRLDNVQGNILRGYRGGLRHVRHMMLAVADPAAARRFLAAASRGGSVDVPAITRAPHWGAADPPACFNIGLTHAGLRALGVAEAMLATFPREFVEGMAERAVKLGDIGDSAPANWPAPFDRPDRIHLVATGYANSPGTLDAMQAAASRAFDVLGVRDGRARTERDVLGSDRDGDNLPARRVFFGYADSIAQPRFAVDGHAGSSSTRPLQPLGTVLLGYPTQLEGVFFRVPLSDELGRDGAFNAFRVMAQDVSAFEAYLDDAGEALLRLEQAGGPPLLPVDAEASFDRPIDRLGALREAVAAQMCGRWRNGTPVAVSPFHPLPAGSRKAFNDFDYRGATTCPAGAHIRRVNPRDGMIVQRNANYARQLVRRGTPYGPDFDAAQPDDRERGLLGNFLCASLGAQYEAVMSDWLNLGLSNPDVTGINDPLIGTNTPEMSVFDLRLADGLYHHLRGFPRFVTTRGGSYTFLPSLAAIDYLAALPG